MGIPDSSNFMFKIIIKNTNQYTSIQQDKWIKYDVEFLISPFIYLFQTY